MPFVETPVVAIQRREPMWLWLLVTAGVVCFAFEVASTGLRSEPTCRQRAIVREGDSKDFETLDEADALQDRAGGASGTGQEAAAASQVNRAAGVPEFVSLFNGKDLAGWRAPGNASQSWRVSDGVLEGSGRPTASTLLTTLRGLREFSPARGDQAGRGTQRSHPVSSDAK